MPKDNIDFLKLREAIEAAWRPDTAYLEAEEGGNPSLGQCYVTSKIIQEYFPGLEIVKGRVMTPKGEETHFWNLHPDDGLHIDLTWQQFDPETRVISWEVLSRNNLGDGPETIERLRKLRSRIQEYLV